MGNSAADTFMGFAPAPPGLCELVWPGAACRVEAQKAWPLVRRMCWLHAGSFLDPVFRGCGCGPEPCPACARHISSGLRVLVVGERENGPEHCVKDAQLAELLGRSHKEVPDEVPTRHGPLPRAEYVLRQFHRQRRAFSWGASRQRLIGLGLRWDAAVNLLGSSPRVGAWDEAAAAEVAGNLAPFLAGWRVVACGTRVAEALEASFGLLRPQGAELHRLWHPSGRNRLWQQPQTAAEARARVDALYGREL